MNLTRRIISLNLRSGVSFGSLTLGAAENTNRHTPYFSLAGRMFCVPRVIGLLLASLPVFKTLITVFVPSTARSTAAGSLTSFCTTVKWSCFVPSLEGLRTNATTSYPTARACSTSGLPVLPDAPKIVSFTVVQMPSSPTGPV